MELKLTENFWYRINGEKTLSELFVKFNSDCVTRNNNDIALYDGEWVNVKVNNYISHFVKPAEDLIKIAEIYKTNKEKLMQDNNLQTEKLFIGQRLKIFK